MPLGLSVLVPAKSWSSAWVAVVALVTLQVGFGLLYQSVRNGENFTYAFSSSGSVCLAEFLKLAISTVLFFREWLQRRDDFHYQIIGDSASSDPSEKGMIGTAVRKSWWQFPRAVLREVRQGSIIGFVQLAMLYAVINNDVFILLRIADPGTVQLLNSGIAIIPAVVVTMALGIGFGELQWIAIMTQACPPICGLVISQFSPEINAIYPATTYLFAMVYSCATAFIAVYNQVLNQSSNASLHADNMVLFSVGSFTNLAIHLIVRWWSPYEPGILAGYTDPVAVVLVLSSVFIGLAATAVYKCSDVVTKCFATSASTVILLFLSALIFRSGIGIYPAFGATVVFLAVWLYFKAPKEQDPGWVPLAAEATTPSSGSSRDESRSDVWGGLLSEGSTKTTGRMGWFSIAIRVVATIAIVIAGIRVAAEKPSGQPSQTVLAPPPPTPDTLTSPLRNVLAFIRWSSDEHQDRKQTLGIYRRFFYDLHYSIPGTTDLSNIAVDGFEDSYLVYQQVAKTMQLLLDEQPDVTGLLYYKSDSWVDPLRFNSIDLNKIWFPDSIRPRFICMEDTTVLPEAFIGEEDARRAKKSVKALSDSAAKIGYTINPDEICTGWSEIYYIPRRFFEDYINLAAVFAHNTVYYELAIPTMVSILHKIHSPEHAYDGSVVEALDCWSSPQHPTKEDLSLKKCGHGLNNLDQEPALGFYFRIASLSVLIENNSDRHRRMLVGTCGWATNPWWSGWMCPDLEFQAFCDSRQPPPKKHLISAAAAGVAAAELR